MSVLWAIEEIKKFVAFPGLTPLQPGGDVHPCKQACLTEPPHPSGLPLADGKPQAQWLPLAVQKGSPGATTITHAW